MKHVLLGVTGSVAAIKTPMLYAALTAAGHSVRVVCTRAGQFFFDPAGLPAFVRDEDEWPGERYQRGDEVLHIELRKWADVLVIAPLDANTLAKLAYGLADNCLSCVARAWDPARPVVLAPAMNTLMWEHPATVRHLRQLAADRGLQPPADDQDAVAAWINGQNCGLTLVGPVSKQLACGDVGMGGMAEVAEIAAAVGNITLTGA